MAVRRSVTRSGAKLFPLDSHLRTDNHKVFRMGMVYSHVVSDEVLRIILLNARSADLLSCKLVSKCISGH